MIEPPRTVTGWPLGAAMSHQSWLLSVTRTAMRSPALSFQSAPQSVSGIVELPGFLTRWPWRVTSGPVQSPFSSWLRS